MKLQESKKIPFWKKALEMVKGGDESRMKSFVKENDAALTNQILIRSAEMEGLRTQILEKDAHFVEAALKVDVTKIGSYKERQEYLKEYNKKLSDVLNEQEKLEAELNVKEKEVKRFEKIKELLASTFEEENE